MHRMPVSMMTLIWIWLMSTTLVHSESQRYLVDGSSGVIDFSMLTLKENHESRPLWVCPNFRIFLDVSSRLYEKVIAA